MRFSSVVLHNVLCLFSCCLIPGYVGLSTAYYVYFELVKLGGRVFPVEPAVFVDAIDVAVSLFWSGGSVSSSSASVIVDVVFFSFPPIPFGSVRP